MARDAETLEQEIARLRRRVEEQDRKIEGLVNTVRGLPAAIRAIGEIQGAIAAIRELVSPGGVAGLPAAPVEQPREPAAGVQVPPEHQIDLAGRPALLEGGPAEDGRQPAVPAVGPAGRAERRQQFEEARRARREAFETEKRQRREAIELQREIRAAHHVGDVGPPAPAVIQPQVPAELRDVPPGLARRLIRERRRFEVAQEQEQLAEQRVRRVRAGDGPQERVTQAVQAEQRAEAARGRAAERLRAIEQQIQELRGQRRDASDRGPVSDQLRQILEKVEGIAQNQQDAITARYA